MGRRPRGVFSRKIDDVHQTSLAGNRAKSDDRTMIGITSDDADGVRPAKSPATT